MARFGPHLSTGLWLRILGSAESSNPKAVVKDTKSLFHCQLETGPRY